jgi:hypothetical protein
LKNLPAAFPGIPFAAKILNIQQDTKANEQAHFSINTVYYKLFYYLRDILKILMYIYTHQYIVMMKNIVISFLLTVSVSALAGVQHLLPRPQQLSNNSTVQFVINRTIDIQAPTQQLHDPQLSTELTSWISAHQGTVSGQATAKIIVELTSTVAGAEFQEEAYQLKISADTIHIKATTLKGAFWATQTLWQLSENESALPGLTITDWPAFRIRGYMHDVGRSYMQFETLKKHIEKLARYKVNVFHWHLTENQGWRLESKIYPQLNGNSAFSRHHGQYYTIDQAKELVRFARQRGITVIPEIDMPGHSEAFRKAMGHSMLTPQGLEEMKAIMTEACATFSETEWMHIGTDEVRTPDLGTIDWSVFVPQMVAHVRAQGKKVVSWNPGFHYGSSDIDMTQMWSSSGSVTPGVPAIDSRYHYINHFDMYADIVALYNSTIAGQTKGSHQYAGVIVAAWNDRVLPSDEAIVRQNNLYPTLLAMAERSWLGGGKGYFNTIGVMLDPLDQGFIDFERRLLHHKKNHLSTEPIDYVKQTNVRWRITDAFPNSGNTATAFPPESSLETSYNFNGKTYATRQATGAGIYLRHVWGPATIPAFYANPQTNSTAYAYTYVYSPVDQQTGLQIEFQNYGRSEADLAPPTGRWDYNYSRIWINDTEILPPTWQNTHTTKSNEITLKNENFSARPLPLVTLKQGWNKVLLKLPVGAFSISQVRLVKWMFTCVFVTPDGKSEVENLIYSPEKNDNPGKDILILAIDNANSFLTTISIGSSPGKFRQSRVDEFKAKISKAGEIAGQNHPNNIYEQEAATLSSQLDLFKQTINTPRLSNEKKKYWYSLTTPLRNGNANNTIAWQGNNAVLKGETLSATAFKQQWKFEAQADNSLAIINRQDPRSCIHPGSAYNTALKAQIYTSGIAGWTLIPTFTNSNFAISSGNVQMNQTQSGLNYQIYNWGGGSNTTDTGCQYFIQLEGIEGGDALDSLSIRIDELRDATNGLTLSNEPGYISEDSYNQLATQLTKCENALNSSEYKPEDFRQFLNELNLAYSTFTNSINLPLASTSDSVYLYSITVQRDSKSIAWQGANATLKAATFIENTPGFSWKFKLLNDGSHSICDANESYFIESAASGTPPVLVGRQGIQTSGGWKIQLIDRGPWFIVANGNNQINVSNAGTGYTLYNWGGGTNITDTGCLFKFTLQSTRIISSVNSTQVDNPLFNLLIENRRIINPELLPGIKAYTTTGSSVSVNHPLPSGIILLKYNEFTRKLIVI